MSQNNNYRNLSSSPKSLGHRALSSAQQPLKLHIPRAPADIYQPRAAEAYNNHPLRQNTYSTYSTSRTRPTIPPRHSTLSSVHSHKTLNSTNGFSNYSHPTLNSQTSSLSTTHTPYITMLLALDTIPLLHSILASASTWLLLAGFVILPTAFDKVDTSKLSGTSQTIYKSVHHVPILILASISLIFGILGMCFVWLKNRDNYIWITSKVFMPGVLNSAMGLLNTLVNVYGSSAGKWGNTATVTGSVEGAILGVCGVLWAFYYFGKLSGVKKVHAREMEIRGGVGSGIEKSGRMA